jgi:leucyl aminopeptidase (aminopeptidase T)
MANDSVLTLIDAEIAKLKQVRSLLAHTGKIAAKIIAIKSKLKERKAKLVTAKKSAKAKKAAKAAAKAPVKAVAKVAARGSVKARKPRVLSPEARQRIADAQRKRWAAQKATA